MDELLKAIEGLKRAYKASGAKSVKIELVDGDTKTAEIVVAKTIKLNGEDKTFEATFIGTEQQKPITNGEWLRGLSDEELAHQIWLLCHIDVGTHWLCDEVGKEGCDRVMGRCKQCRIAWLRAEHKE